MDCDIIQKSNIYAGQMAGEYLEELKQFNVLKLTPKQWGELINVITKNYELRKKELTLD